MGPKDVLMVVRQRWVAGLVGLALGGALGILLTPGVVLGGVASSASGEVAFRGEFSLIGDDLVDGRRFANEASTRAVALVKSPLILDPVREALIDEGVLDATVTVSMLGANVSAQIDQGSTNLVVRAHDADPALALAITTSVMEELTEYFDTGAEFLPDGSRSFIVSVESEAAEDEAVQDRISLIALTVVLALVGAGVAVALSPYFATTVRDEADLDGIARRAFGAGNSTVSLPNDVRRADEVLSSWLAVFLLHRADPEANRIALIAACGQSPRASVIAEMIAQRMRVTGRGVVVLDADSTATGASGLRENVGVTLAEERASDGDFVVLFSSRLGSDPEVAGIAAVADSTVVLVERAITSRRDLQSGLRSLSLVGTVPAAIPLLD